MAESDAIRVAADQTFDPDERLYRRFSAEDYDRDRRKVLVGAIRFPDCSCNRSRYSTPKQVLSPEHPRENGVVWVLVDKIPSEIQTPFSPMYDVRVVHDPDYDSIPPNPAHTEVRTNKKGEPWERGSKMSRSAEKKLRQVIADEMKVEIVPTSPL